MSTSTRFTTRDLESLPDPQLVATLLDGDTLSSSLLPGFACPVARFWT